MHGLRKKFGPKLGLVKLLHEIYHQGNCSICNSTIFVGVSGELLCNFEEVFPPQETILYEALYMYEHHSVALVYPLCAGVRFILNCLFQQELITQYVYMYMCVYTCSGASRLANKRNTCIYVLISLFYMLWNLLIQICTSFLKDYYIYFLRMCVGCASLSVVDDPFPLYRFCALKVIFMD